MINFSPTSYGSDTAVKLPDLDMLDRSTQRKNEYAIRGEEMKLKRKLEDRDYFMKMLEVDPVSAISEANMTRQAYALEKYNNDMASLYAETDGILGQEAVIKAAKAKNDLKREQNLIKTSEAKYAQALRTIQLDNNYYDRDHFRKASEYFLINGTEPKEGFLSVQAQNPLAYLSKLPAEEEIIEPTRVDVRDAKNNIVGQQDVTFTSIRSEDSAKRAIAMSFMEEPVAKGWIQMFEKLSPDKQYEILKDYDTSGDRRIDPAERNVAYSNMDLTSNPIVQWAMNDPEIIRIARQRMAGATKNIPSASGKATSGSDWATSTFGTRQVKYKIGSEAIDTPIENVTFQQYHSFEGLPAVNIAIRKGAPIQPLTSGAVTSLEGAAGLTGEIMGYDEATDQFIIRLIKEFTNIGLSGIDGGIGTQIAVPRKDLSGNYDDIVILKDGKRVKIGELNRGTAIQSPAKPKMTFREYTQIPGNEKKTFTDYNNEVLNGNQSR